MPGDGCHRLLLTLADRCACVYPRLKSPPAKAASAARERRLGCTTAPGVCGRIVRAGWVVCARVVTVKYLAPYTLAHDAHTVTASHRLIPNYYSTGWMGGETYVGAKRRETAAREWCEVRSGTSRVLHSPGDLAAATRRGISTGMNSSKGRMSSHDVFTRFAETTFSTPAQNIESFCPPRKLIGYSIMLRCPGADCRRRTYQPNLRTRPADWPAGGSLAPGARVDFSRACSSCRTPAAAGLQGRQGHETALGLELRRD